MIRVLCRIGTEDRLWNMRRALRRLEESHFSPAPFKPVFPLLRVTE